MQQRLGEIRALGAEAVAVSQSSPEAVAAMLRAEPLSLPLLCDPDRATYRAFGLERGGWGMFLRPWVLAHYIGRMLSGWEPRRPVPGEDLLQLGGDFILDRQGRIAFAHRSTDPSDRPAVDVLLDRLAACVKGKP